MESDFLKNKKYSAEIALQCRNLFSVKEKQKRRGSMMMVRCESRRKRRKKKLLTAAAVLLFSFSLFGVKVEAKRIYTRGNVPGGCGGGKNYP